MSNTPEKADTSGGELTDQHLAEIVVRLPLLPLQMDAQGRATWLGPQWEAYTGIAPDALLGEAWRRLIHPADLEAAARAWTLPRQHGPLREQEMRLRTADGTYHWVLTRATALTDTKTGEVTGWVGTCLDIEAQKERMQSADAYAVLQADALLREREARSRAEESERRVRVVAEVAQALAQSTSLEAVLEAATEALSGAFTDAGAGVWLHEAPSKRLRLSSVRGYSEEGRRIMADVPEDHPSAVAEAFRRRDAVVYNREDARMPSVTRRLAATSAPEGVSVSVSAAPLLVAGRILGALSLVVRDQDLDDSWLETLRAVGAQVAAAVERTTLYERERAIAARLQGALLPALENEAIHKATGLAIAHRYRSGTEGITVGGDFYDVWSLPAATDTPAGETAAARLAVVVGDVSGKGLEAAVQTAALRHAVQAYAHHDPTPALVVTKVSELVMALDLLPHSFATMFFATVEAKTGRIEYCSAGHETLLLRRQNGDIQPLEANAPALGLIAFTGVAAQAVLDAGGQLVLYTDGVTEARQPEARQRLGVGGLTPMLSEVALDLGEGLSAAELASRLLQRIEAYAGGRLEDDAALLVIMRPREAALSTAVAASSGEGGE